MCPSLTRERERDREMLRCSAAAPKPQRDLAQNSGHSASIPTPACQSKCRTQDVNTSFHGQYLGSLRFTLYVIYTCMYSQGGHFPDLSPLKCKTTLRPLGTCTYTYIYQYTLQCSNGPPTLFSLNKKF